MYVWWLEYTLLFVFKVGYYFLISGLSFGCVDVGIGDIMGDYYFLREFIELVEFTEVAGPNFNLPSKFFLISATLCLSI